MRDLRLRVVFIDCVSMTYVLAIPLSHNRSKFYLIVLQRDGLTGTFPGNSHLPKDRGMYGTSELYGCTFGGAAPPVPCASVIRYTVLDLSSLLMPHGVCLKESFGRRRRKILELRVVMETQ